MLRILEGMTLEVHEEPDDVKLVREVMEEPLETIHATITAKLPFDLKRIFFELAGDGPSDTEPRKKPDHS